MPIDNEIIQLISYIFNPFPILFIIFLNLTGDMPGIAENRFVLFQQSLFTDSEYHIIDFSASVF